MAASPEEDDGMAAAQSSEGAALQAQDFFPGPVGARRRWKHVLELQKGEAGEQQTAERVVNEPDFLPNRFFNLNGGRVRNYA